MMHQVRILNLKVTLNLKSSIHYIYLNSNSIAVDNGNNSSAYKNDEIFCDFELSYIDAEVQQLENEVEVTLENVLLEKNPDCAHENHKTAIACNFNENCLYDLSAQRTPLNELNIELGIYLILKLSFACNSFYRYLY